MRTDAKFSRRQVICPKVTLLGFNTVKARPGYWIGFSMDGTASDYQVGRVLGRVDAPAIGEDKEPIKGWIVALVLSRDATFCFERWIHPDWVKDCVARRPQAFLSWFTGDEMPTDIPTAIRLCETGVLSEQHIHNVYNYIKKLAPVAPK